MVTGSTDSNPHSSEILAKLIRNGEWVLIGRTQARVTAEPESRMANGRSGSISFSSAPRANPDVIWPSYQAEAVADKSGQLIDIICNGFRTSKEVLSGKLCASRDCQMNIKGLVPGHVGRKLRIMSDEDLPWLYLHHRQEGSPEFREEVENRKAAGILAKDSPFWTVTNVGRYFPYRKSSNVVELSREEWEARRRRKMFRVIST